MNFSAPPIKQPPNEAPAATPTATGTSNGGDAASMVTVDRTSAVVRAAPDEWLAANFGAHIARWSRQQGASAAAASLARRAAILVSHATSNGHSCLALDELVDALHTIRANVVDVGDAGDAGEPDGTVRDTVPLNLAALRRRLLASKVVGTPDAPDSLPLILDEERLYLHRYFDYECRLARSLSERGSSQRRAAIAPLNDLPPQVVALLDELFVANILAPGAIGAPRVPDWQKIAAITALLGRLTIISGGPGTGKTTTVVNLLACLLEADPDCRIALTAPTGKAAARMTEVILHRAGHLPDTLRAQLPTAASTIHRLLGRLPNGEFRHDAANELPIDVVVVDEASMLDLALAVHLIEAVPKHARIILLGDKDQLAAVESGAVFSELSAQPAFSASRRDALSRLANVHPQSLQPALAATATAVAMTKATTATPAGQLDLPFPPERHSSLEDSVIWLRHNYRFAAGSAIGLLAADTNHGNAARVLARLQSPPDASLRWVNDPGKLPSAESLHAMFMGYALYTEAVRSSGGDPAAATDAFARFRVLCAVRDGPWGVDAINQQITRHFRHTLQHPLDPGLRSEWYPGRPVMVLRNDAVLKLFNGDIGIVLPDGDGTLQVYFPTEHGGLRPIAPLRIPDHETAFAMTVHKSQGSEFDELLLVLPAATNRVLTRELFYTAVTRARHRLALVANAAVVATTVETATKRVSGLLTRLRNQGR